MNTLFLSLAAPALGLAATIHPSVPQAGKRQAPPGLVLIPGGSTKIGTTVKAAEEYGKSDPNRFAVIARETPQFEKRLDDFWLMTTEVTNEQYFVFVKATGARPPESWAAKLIDAASNEFITKQGEERAKAKAEGRPVPEMVKFERAEWWRKNWKDKPYAIAPGEETLPVVYVDHRDAQAYARWAGLRLPTEFEFQRAGRGNTDNEYPWGDEPGNGTRAVTEELKIDGKEVKPNRPFKVASFPSGKSQQGIFDLGGNVWEWTSSPWSFFPGHKDLTITVGKGSAERTISGIARWDANQRVVVGGCFQAPLMAARVAYRRGEERHLSTDSVGFRCAASVTPGVDLAGLLLSDELTVDRRPPGSLFDPARVVATDRWTSSPGSATTALEAGKPPVAVPGYAVIESYESIMFVPAIELEIVSSKTLADLSHESGPVPLGILSTTRAVVHPALDKGAYVVCFRAAGEIAKPVEAGAKGEKDAEKGDKKGMALGTAQDGGKEQEPEVQEKRMAEFKAPEGFDPKVDALIFYAPGGEPVTWMPAPNLDCSKPVEGRVTIGNAKRTYQVQKPGGLLENKIEDATLLTMAVNGYAKISNKAASMTLPLYFRLGELDSSWRTK
jgi:formylglycine-generating enzyme required for sulfatase activity